MKLVLGALFVAVVLAGCVSTPSPHSDYELQTLLEEYQARSAEIESERQQRMFASIRRVDVARGPGKGGFVVSVDLAGRAGIVGYRAKRHTAVVDVDKRAGYDVVDFWEAIEARPPGSLILDPDEFYILASKEAVHVPPAYAAEMVPFDPLVGEFRVHYAGFFDPGFGHAAAGGHGARAVLEVRSRDVPFIIEDGQIVGRLVYEHLTERPKALYGTDIGSHYQAQGLKLSKHFHLPTS